MQFSFDLISDLHIETWDTDFDWSNQPTSPYCIVAGDVARDQDTVIQTLKHLGECYKGGVFYIDGNDEHRNNVDTLDDSYKSLNYLIQDIENVVYMQDNVVIINGVAIVATNGWWSYDFDLSLDFDQCQTWNNNHVGSSGNFSTCVTSLAFGDTAYLRNSVRKLQYHQDVRSIVVVTHTVPFDRLVNHDPDLVGTLRYNCLGNAYMSNVLAEDLENKISTWCFGHYHKSVDRMIDGVRYVNNCRGRGDTPWKQVVYYPKRITVDY